MSVRVFMKRLVEVEVNPQRSNQHEFNAGVLRRELGFQGDPTRGHVEFLFYNSDQAEPVAVRESYTLYDARRDTPQRTEWRMYYTNLGVAAHARVDDLMLLFRPDSGSTDLIAVIARRGTTVERALAKQLAGCAPEELGESLFVDSRNIDADTCRLLLRSLESPVSAAEITDVAIRSNPLFQHSVAHRVMPTTGEMAGAAQQIIADLGVTASEPDAFMQMALKAETALFMSIERELGSRQLAKVIGERQLDFGSVMDICTSFSQRRRSRRGRSLENHFRFLLEDLEIRHSFQCTTERGRTPDFIFPSCEDYHDPGYPSDLLRMVGCKTVVRERHTQWLEEADRVSLKYALCVDPDLSDRVVQGYRHRLRFFVPQNLMVEEYADRDIRALLGSVADLVDNLRHTSG